MGISTRFGGVTAGLFDGLVFDSLSFGPQQTDISFGRYPNGTGSFTTMPTTFAKNNSLTSGTSVLNEDHLLKIYPNPAGDYLHVRTAAPLETVRIVNHLGNDVLTVHNSGELEITIPVYTLPGGMYWIISGRTGAVPFVKY